MKNNVEMIDSSHTDAEVNDKIRHRAYELYEQRGKTDGSDLEDWLQASAEVQSGTKVKEKSLLSKSA